MLARTNPSSAPHGPQASFVAPDHIRKQGFEIRKFGSPSMPLENIDRFPIADSGLPRLGLTQGCPP